MCSSFKNNPLRFDPAYFIALGSLTGIPIFGFLSYLHKYIGSAIVLFQFIGMLLCICFMYFIAILAVKINVNIYFKNREKVTEKEFYQNFYINDNIPREVVEAVFILLGCLWEYYYIFTGLPIGKIRPTDKFRDLSLLVIKPYNDPISDLFKVTEKFFNYLFETNKLPSDMKKKIEYTFKSIESIDDYIKFIDFILKKSNSNLEELEYLIINSNSE
jgi:hypothetical protein